MLFLDEGFTFRNFLVDVFTVFVFIAWFWLLITVFMDLFRRHDISGWAKAIWVIALIIFPLLAVLAYLITQSRGWPSEMPNKLSKRAMSFDVLLVSAPLTRSRSSTV
jgi:hypothetical protein